ncbi:MAG TPA: hypothetical protein VF622_00855 [Segetibacter sp.]|jgi:hypothetical protein
MPNLYFYVSAEGGRYGIMQPANLPNGQTFGSQGASVCVILLLITADGNLFCGHMACGISGRPDNRGIIMERATLLLATALGEANRGQAWNATSNSTDVTTTWMKQAMEVWFTNAPAQKSNAYNDGYFTNNDNTFPVTLSNNMGQDGATEVDTGNFTIEPNFDED